MLAWLASTCSSLSCSWNAVASISSLHALTNLSMHACATCAGTPALCKQSSQRGVDCSATHQPRAALSMWQSNVTKQCDSLQITRLLW